MGAPGSARLPFPDRQEAGRVLGARLVDAGFADRPDVLVLGLPRGGVVTAAPVAAALRAPLDAYPVRKLGLPGRPELAMGAIAGDGTVVRNEDVIERSGVPQDAVEHVVAAERAELARRARAYRDDRPPADVTGRTVILVDDGLATGATARAAVRALRGSGPARIVVAVPVAPAAVCTVLEAEADDVLCLACPDPFGAVGRYYLDFESTTDAEVRLALGC